MPIHTLRQVEDAIRRSWSAETCDPVDLPWSPANPSSGQCGTTALVINDLLGGDLLVADVRYADGAPQGHHTWNRLSGGIDVDLTRAQFGPDEVVQEPRLVSRPDGPPRRCAEQYGLLRRRVYEVLGLPSE